MHHLDGSASSRAATPGDRQRLTPVGRHRIIVLEAGENVVFVVHLDPGSFNACGSSGVRWLEGWGGSTDCIHEALHGRLRC
jgi:hypothetical protein